jgi:LPS sulfotransferase NodH/Tfp pilus assembly protein PilF
LLLLDDRRSMKSAEKQILNAYLICATPRTGSTLLQEALHFTYIAGNPLEYFGLSQQHWMDELKGESGDTYIEKVLSSGTTSNGVFGAKILGYQFRPMIEFLRDHYRDHETKLAPFLDKVFPNLRYIWMRRRDKVAQAMSESIAAQTLIWQQVEYNPTKIPAKEPVFDFQNIDEYFKLQEAYDRQWQEFFAQNRITPLILDYEDLASNYLESVYKVLTFLDLPTNVPIRRPRLARQANAASRDWKERYHAMSLEERAASPAIAGLTPSQAFEQAVQLHKRGRAREAEELYVAVLRAEPDHLDALHNLGLLRLEEGKAREAESLLGQVLAKLPNSARLLNNYGVAVDALKRHETAVKHFRRALQITPNYAECHNNLGNALQGLGRHEEAQRHYLRALSLRPDYVDAHRNLGRALLNQATACRARAVAHFEKTLTLKPEDADAYCGLGTAHLALNQFDKAITCLAKAIAINPEHAEARQQLAATAAAAEQQARTVAEADATKGKSNLQLADDPKTERGAA